MDKPTRAELIAELVTDKYSGFKDGDEAILEAASDARLEEFRASSETRKASTGAFSKLETEHRNVAARLKVAEEKIKAAEQNPTEEEWLAKAPSSIKVLLDHKKQQEDDLRASFISQLKDLGNNTEEELKAMTIPQLETLAKYARVEVSDFSGRGLPMRSAMTADNDDFTPPNPYDEPIKTLRAKIN